MFFYQPKSNYWCTPAILNLVLSLLTIISLAIYNFSLITISLKILYTVVWTWFLNYLCVQGYSSISWFLVLMPFIFAFFILLFFFDLISNSKYSPSTSSNMSPMATVSK